jgi:hypothetical protein
MLSIIGIYEKGKVRLLEDVKDQKRSKVIITFVEDVSEANENDSILGFTSQTESIGFWNDEAENLYQDYLPKSKK